MRPIILAALLIVAMSSCSTYQYVTLSSPQVPKNDKNEFIFENDTMKLVYNFHGEGGPMNLTVYNKTSQPLYVDWKKSALIEGNQPTSLFNRNVQISGTSTTSNNYPRTRLTPRSSSVVNLSFDLPEGMDFIPPGTHINKELATLVATAEPLKGTVAENSKQEKQVGPDGMTVIKWKRASFEEGQSPLTFKSYLTFVLGQNASLEFSIQHSFYVKEVLETHNGPELFNLYGQGGDNLYVRQSL